MGDETNMPFTPFHLGPALGFGLPLRKYLHVPTFLVANIFVDVEPFLVLSLGLDYPLHGYLHTFVVAFILGLALGYAMFLLERISRPLYTTLLLESSATPKLKSFIVAGVLGTMLHVLLDSPLYDDIRPFYPLLSNPLYHLASSSEVYGFCTWMGILGIAFYLGLLVFSVYRGLEKKGRRTYPSPHAFFGNAIRRYRKKPISTKQTRSITVRTPASTPMKKTSEWVG
jgi:membrane-bound metal-dependent hydrolase YbcI (DUF457 family)